MDAFTNDEKLFICKVFAHIESQLDKKESNKDFNKTFDELFLIREKNSNKKICANVLSKLLSNNIIKQSDYMKEV